MAMETAARRDDGSHVLVVDDDEDLLNMVAEVLTLKGYRVQVARHGLEALAQIEKQRPQLILLDMRMPVMDGWQFAREFRNRYGRSVPIVVVTAAEDSQLRANEIGADAYLGKPFNLDDLYEVVEDTVIE
jgi:CheY-like chemotaxis protein